MVIGVCRIYLQIPESHSLKDKRRVVKSLTQRVQARFNVSVAEVADQELWQSAEIGIVAVSSSGRHVDDVMQTVIRFVEENLQGGFVADVQTELLHVD
jgi:uncharacterized protein YlxP (DUF503 family)